jgi:hypothetical protein
VAGEYGVTSIPWLFLIGPDGKLLARNLLDETILWETMQALEGDR